MKFLNKVYQSVMLDISWLQFRHLPLGYRIGYIFRKYYALARRKKTINYLNENIIFDNLSMPATLQSYPDEVANVCKWLSNDEPVILDIGANIGQFSTTTAFLFPKARIFSFEPNPVVFDMLVKNTKSKTSITCFNLAIGPAGNIPFFYVPGWTGKGSFIKSNANINLSEKEPQQINVKVVELDPVTLVNLNIPQYYDLVKIDVEGYEANVLDALTGINTGLLYVEASLNRERDYSLVLLLKKIERIMGDIDLLYIDKIDKNNAGQTIVNILIGKVPK